MGGEALDEDEGEVEGLPFAPEEDALSTKALATHFCLKALIATTNLTLSPTLRTPISFKAL